MFNFEPLDMLWAWVRYPSQKLWPFEFAKSFLVQIWASRYMTGLNHMHEWKVMAVWILLMLSISISSISMYYGPESEIWVKSYDRLNFLRASVVKYRASWYIMGLNHTPKSKVLAVWICRELSFSKSSASIYYFPESDIRVKKYGNFARASVVQFCASRYVKGLNHTPESKFKAIWIFLLLPCTISKISMHYGPESDIRDKGYDRLNFWRASIDQFRASRYIMHLNQTSEWKVMTIWISRDLPLFNCECLDISWVSTIHPSQHIWLFEFAQSFGVQFWASRYITGLNQTSKSKVMAVWISFCFLVQFLASLCIMGLNKKS